MLHFFMKKHGSYTSHVDEDEDAAQLLLTRLLVDDVGTDEQRAALRRLTDRVPMMALSMALVSRGTDEDEVAQTVVSLLHLGAHPYACGVFVRVLPTMKNVMLAATVMATKMRHPTNSNATRRLFEVALGTKRARARAVRAFVEDLLRVTSADESLAKPSTLDDDWEEISDALLLS